LGEATGSDAAAGQPAGQSGAASGLVHARADATGSGAWIRQGAEPAVGDAQSGSTGPVYQPDAPRRRVGGDERRS